jgi:subtilase family protein
VPPGKRNQVEVGVQQALGRWVVAAGNWGRNPVTGVAAYAGVTSPGNAPSAITVGALRYFRLSGTSMAAAITTGVVALMLEQRSLLSDEPLTPNDVKGILQFTAIPVTTR